MKYLFFISPSVSVARVTLPGGGEGSRDFVAEMSGGIQWAVRDGVIGPGALGAFERVLPLEFPDDDAALAFREAFDRLYLDPWRVGLVLLELPGESVILYARDEGDSKAI